jgi:hypothetical protein
MKRLPFILLLLMFSGSTRASTGDVAPVVHKAVIEVVAPDACLKLLFTGIHDMLPTADMTHDADTGTLMIISTITLSWGELEAVVNASGHALISLEIE